MEAKQPRESPIGMQRLTSTSSIYTPPNHRADSPTILLHTWMNAAPAHVQFYLRKWSKLLPDARIIVILGTTPDMVYRTATTQKQNLGPVILALRAEPTSPIYMHLFSNAGANSGALLLHAFKESSVGQKDLLPLKALVLDSTPSRGTYESAYAGLIYQIPRSPMLISYLGAFLVHALVIVAIILEYLSGRLNVLSKSGNDLNDSSLVQIGIPKIYCYSEQDRLVKWEDIEHHAAIAKSKGWTVKCKKFQGTDHCRHAKGTGETMYWQIIEDLIGSQ